MKKRFKLWTAYMLILCISMAVMLPSSRAVKADDTGDVGTLLVRNFEINKLKDDGTKEPLYKGTTSAGDNLVELKDNDELSIKFDWALRNEDDYKTYRTEISNYKHIRFEGKQIIKLWKKDSQQSVGTLTVETDESNGKIIITADFDDDYAASLNRNGWAEMNAYAEVYMGKDDEGDKKSINLNTDTFWFKYTPSGDGSALGVWKYPNGSMDKDTHQQEFRAGIWASGYISKIELKDTHGSGLRGPIEIKIINSSVAGIAVGDEMSLDNLSKLLTDKGMQEGDYVDFTYTMHVDDKDGKIYDEDGFKEIREDYKNTITAEYTNDAGKQKAETYSAYASVSRPRVDKDCVVDIENKEIHWTVNIELNDFAGEVRNENDIKIIDDMLDEAIEQKIEPKTDSTGKIVRYKLTYTTVIPDKMLKDGNRLVDQYIKNEVAVEIKGHKYKAEKEAVIKADAENVLHKRSTGYDKKTKRISWEIVIENLPTGIKEISLMDFPSEGNHTFVRETVKIQVDKEDPVEPIVKDWSNEDANVPFWLEAYSDKICFSNEIINKVNKITIYVDTQVNDSTVDGKVYKNEARLHYKLGDNTATLSSEDEWENKSAIIKKGTPDSNADSVNYEVEIDLDKFSELEKPIDYVNGSKITIEDTLPEELMLIDCSLTVSTVHSQWWIDNGEEDFISFVTIKEQEEKITFTIDVTGDLYDRISKIEAGDNSAMLKLIYKAKLNDVNGYLKKGEELKLKNTVTGSCDGESIGESTDITVLTPPSLIEKIQKYDQNTAPYSEYTININENRIELPDDKLIVTDEMGGSRLEYIEETIKVQRNDNGSLVTLKRGEDYDYEYSEEKKTVTFSFKDTDAWLIVSYKAYVDAENGEALTEEDTYNIVSISGYSDKYGMDKTFYVGKAFSVKGGAQNGDAPNPSDPETPSASDASKPTEAAKPSESGSGEDPSKNGEVEGEENTVSEPTTVPEKGTGGQPTETESESEGSTDPDNDRNGDLEGEGNLVDTSDNPYVRTLLILLILGVAAAAITEITMLCGRDGD
ncbi:MAG: hypothetical protein NC223_09735 [Butyrivibrio sp.]|nr:hypothetical protein [Butyrivibrio sp.]